MERFKRGNVKIVRVCSGKKRWIHVERKWIFPKNVQIVRVRLVLKGNQVRNYIKEYFF